MVQQIETSVDTPVPPPTEDDSQTREAPLASLESTTEFLSINSVSCGNPEE